ncbi:hypothetical protein PRMUPPPA20_20780 [Xylanibacter ruminicola]|uniref:Glycosyltransferase, group 2 family n=2 Tax=Xylanibacter ruminicola TaxID=839 RepID=D5ET84_XYLR2|nr:glycosyltransferase family 2 protein [Xylanibacter ruminicola]ADE82830.1 glycosyltransferase, group 2 family [Xylanibacter ruminicola 23]GJG33969.1 hypothetical protein PRMUPPPA20_20780 [Xylanibacter ruminicola]SEH65441.1 Glycosyl transferase family 2 [Xylanibacter ruminicola]
MSKILSIVIPTYNMEKYLQRCLDSLVIEDRYLFEQIEILVINDGSKDRSLEIAQSYQEKFPSVFRAIDKKNGNYGSCINKGLAEATGMFFRILDADDWFDQEALQTVVKALISGQDTFDFVLTNYRAIDVNGTIQDYAEVNMPKGQLDFDSFRFINTPNERLLVMHSITFKTSLLHDVGLKHQEGISYTDIEYCYYPLTTAKSFCYIDATLYQYYIGREGQTVSVESTLAHYNDYYKVALRATNDYLLREKDFSSERKESLCRIIYNPIVSYYRVLLLNKKVLTQDDTQQLSLLDSCVNKVPMLYNRLVKATYRKIPFILIWKKFNIRIAKIIGR